MRIKKLVAGRLKIQELKMRYGQNKRSKMQECKMRHQIALAEKAGVSPMDLHMHHRPSARPV